jgi:hypothetical protein
MLDPGQTMPTELYYGVTSALVAGHEGEPVKIGVIGTFTKEIDKNWDAHVNVGGVVNLMFSSKF